MYPQLCSLQRSCGLTELPAPLSLCPFSLFRFKETVSGQRAIETLNSVEIAGEKLQVSVAAQQTVEAEPAPQPEIDEDDGALIAAGGGRRRGHYSPPHTAM